MQFKHLDLVSKKPTFKYFLKRPCYSAVTFVPGKSFKRRDTLELGMSRIVLMARLLQTQYATRPPICFTTTASLTKMSAAQLASRIIFKRIGWLEFDTNSATQPAKPKFYYILKLIYTVAEQLKL